MDIARKDKPKGKMFFFFFTNKTIYKLRTYIINDLEANTIVISIVSYKHDLAFRALVG